MKFLSSKRVMIVVFLVFCVAVVIFNFFDITHDFTSFRQYTQKEIEDMDFQYVNINTADLKTLCSLPYIGEAQAKAIIDYREENGDFESIEDIMKVKGIGETIFLKIELNITI